jgi:RNA polymerase sigma factor for flagellar operon FliA
MSAYSVAAIAELPPAAVTPAYRLGAAKDERNERIERFLPLVAQVLSKIRRTLPPHADIDELYSAGVTGLISAVERFVPSQANSFPGYVCLRVRGAILDELRRLDPCSRSSRSRSRKIQQAILEVEQELGRAPTDRELSAQLKITVAELERWREITTPVRLLSLDAPVDSDSDSSSALHEAIADTEHTCVRDRMEHQELLDLLTDRMGALPEIQQRVLSMYYFDGMRFAEIGGVFDITETRVCQIHKEAVRKLERVIRSAQQR